MTYGMIKNLLNNGYIACYDSTRIATLAFNPTTQTVFSYDDATSIAAKVTYIHQVAWAWWRLHMDGKRRQRQWDHDESPDARSQSVEILRHKQQYLRRGSC